MKKRKGIGLVTILVIVVLVIFLFGGILSFIFIGANIGGLLDKATGVATAGSGCFVSNSAFTDTSIVSKKDEVIAKITQKWPNAKQNEKYIREVFDRGEKEGINPLVPLSIWLGEQIFGSPEKAFSYGHLDSGKIRGVDGWKQQLDGVFSSLNKVLKNSYPYDTPIGTNNFTRLFFHYTTAMKYVYENNGNSWNEEGEYTDGSKPVKVRLSLFRLVAESQITCEQKTLVAGSRTGNDGVPLYKQVDYKQAYGSSTIAASGCCTVSATMVMNFFRINVDPVEISNISNSNGYYIPGQGTNHAGLYPFLANRYKDEGLKFENLGTNWNKAISYLKGGKPLIARGQGVQPYTKSGHCIVLTGYDEANDMIRINNPASGDGPYKLGFMKQYTTVIYYLGKWLINCQKN